MNYKEKLNVFLGKIYLRPFITALRSLKILEFDLGHFKSSLKWSALDQDNNPIPWFSYPTINYLDQINMSNKVVFEYGSGNSSIYWAKRAKKIISIENNPTWFSKVKSQETKFKNFKINLQKDKQKYIKSIEKSKIKFDIVVIDGSFRYDCAKLAIKKLKRGGFIILDNADWFPKTTKLLRRAGLIQIDFAGFGPINHYRTVTSLFLSQNYKFKPIKSYSSQKIVGGLGNIDD